MRRPRHRRPPPPGPRPRADRHARGFDATPEVYRATGLELTAIDGLQAHTALQGLREIGLDLPRWPSATPVGAGLGRAPNHRVSGGKLLSRRPTPTANRAATALRVAAPSLHGSKRALGAFLRRTAAHLGLPKPITATAYTLARTISSMLAHGSTRVDPDQDAYARAHPARVVRSLSRRANPLGYALVKQQPTHPLTPSGLRDVVVVIESQRVSASASEGSHRLPWRFVRSFAGSG